MCADLIGQKFGRLVVLEKLKERSPRGEVLWKCRCTCKDANIVVARTSSLTCGNTTSCGCINRERLSAEHSVDLTGRVFERLTVVAKSDKVTKSGKSIWLCKCSCGNKDLVEVTVDHLTTGHTKSCGCLHRDMLTKWKDADEKRVVSILNGMRQRCLNPKNRRYSDYGGRGITVCDEWARGEEGKYKFLEWAKSNGYGPGLTIERIDNNGPYSPDNCKWITSAEQSNNKRNSVKIDVGGVTKTLAQWTRYVDGGVSQVRYMYESYRDKFDLLLSSTMFMNQLESIHSKSSKK